MRKVFFVVFVLVSSLTLSFAKEDIIFEHFLRKDGLSNNSVRQIHEDSKGFLWFGTLNGLNKYDGVRVTVYQYQRGIPGTIGSNRILQFHEDSLGSLWVLTNDGKVYMYDDLNDRFVSLSDYLPDLSLHNSGIKDLYISDDLELFGLTSNKGFAQISLNKNGSIKEAHYFSTKNGLPSNIVHFIKKDKQGTTWLGTDNGLVTLREGKIQRVQPEFDNKTITPELSIKCYCDIDSLMLFGTQENGVFVYDRRTGVLSQKKAFDKTITFNISEIITDGNGELYVGTHGNGAYRYNVNSKQIRQLKPGASGSVIPNINEILVDKYGLIWMETSMRGIYQYNPENNKFKYFPLNAEKRQAIGDPEKITPFEDSFGDLWLGIYGGGICKFNRESNEFDQYMFDPNDPHSITSDYVLSINEDHSKNLWIGTLRGGLNKVKLNKTFFKVDQPKPNAQLKIENEVRSLLVDSKDRLWMGTKSGKVYVYNENNELLVTLPDQLQGQSKFNQAGVYCMMEDMHDNIWIGTKGEGIYVLKGIMDKIEKNAALNCEIVHFKNIPFDANSIGNNDVYGLLEIDKNQIWVATHNGGLDVIKSPFSSPVFRNYSSNDNDPTTLSTNMLRCLMKDSYNNVWIGTEYGLNIVDRKYLNDEKKVFKVLLGSDNNSTSLNNNDILTLTQLKNGQIWCGTLGGGINYIENYSGKIDSLKWAVKSAEQGLSSNMVYSILEDKRNQLWISTDYGISRYDMDSGVFKSYYTIGRQESNAYSENSGAKFSNGKMVFGQINGYTIFHPDSISVNKKQYSIYITDLLVDNERVKPGKESILSKAISRTDAITLKHNQNFITFEYAMLDYSNPLEIQYAYMLEGFEKDWNYVGNISMANYKGLPSGDYIFKVKGTNADGIWFNEIAKVNVEILSPWWKSSFAYFGYAVLILGLILTIGFIVLRQLQLQNLVKLEKENTDNKLRFYTNISHELKTPLSLIQGPAEDLMNSRHIPESARYKATEILRNAKRLLELIDQLIDFRKIQKGHIPLKVTELDITEFFRGIYFSFLPLAEKRKINFVFEPKEPLIGYIDVDKIEKIVFNLISNAFKHTEKDKAIKISFNAGKDFTFSVSDEGTGIKTDDLPHIFQRFKLFTKSTHVMDSSSGIGLSLTQELVHVHKGKIEVESKEGEGSTFSITLPINRSSYTQEEIDDNIKPNLHYYDHTEEFLEDMGETPENDPELEKRSAGPDAPSILIIEDNDELRKYLFYNLKPFFNVSLAENGVVGLDKARKEFPDLIMCDVMMPEMDGIEVSKTLKTDFNTSHIPIILLSAKSSEEQKREGLETGADAYVTKPFSLKLLKIQIRNLIEQRKKLMQKFGKKAEVSPVDLGGTNADQQFLTKVIKIIEEKMSDPEFNVNSIVKEFGYGRTVFYKKIKGIAGYAPNDFVRIIRMKKAASALKNTDMSVAEISYMTGFNDSNYFSRTFKKHFGKTPSEYRRS